MKKDGRKVVPFNIIEKMFAILASKIVLDFGKRVDSITKSNHVKKSVAIDLLQESIERAFYEINYPAAALAKNGEPERVNNSQSSASLHGEAVGLKMTIGE